MFNILRKNLITGLLLAVLLPLLGCGLVKRTIGSVEQNALDEIPVGAEVTMGTTSFGHGLRAGTFDDFPEYRIHPGDELDVLFALDTFVETGNFTVQPDYTIAIKFVSVPELNEEQRIRPDGTISLPYLGDVKVVQKTLTELKTELEERYSGVLVDPEITVTVPNFRERIMEIKKDLHTAPRGLSRLATVRPDGYCTFPMIDDVKVSGRTIPDVNEELNEYFDKAIKGMKCNLFLQKGTGFQVYVVGHVKKAGAYRITKPITVVQAITLAESFLPGAELGSIIVVRKKPGERKMIATRLDIESNLSLICGYKFFYLQPDDIVYVPRTWIDETAEVMRDIADIFLFNGWGAGVSLGYSWELHRANSNASAGTTTIQAAP